MFSATVWIMCLHIPFDHLQAAYSRGVLIAFGKQRFVAVSMVITCYVFGAPIILGTTFLTDLKIYGIYIGFFAFTLLNLVAITVRVCRMDLAEEVEKSVERVDETWDEGGGGYEKLNSAENENSSEEELVRSYQDYRTVEKVEECGCNRFRQTRLVVAAFVGAVIVFLSFLSVSVLKL